MEGWDHTSSLISQVLGCETQHWVLLFWEVLPTCSECSRALPSQHQMWGWELWTGKCCYQDAVIRMLLSPLQPPWHILGGNTPLPPGLAPQTWINAAHTANKSDISTPKYKKEPGIAS